MIEIIPAIDILAGKCVRLLQGDFSKATTYSGDPVSIAQMFESHGSTRVHVVDLDGAKNGSIANLGVLEAVARSTNLKIDFGGGVRTLADLQSIFDAGAAIAAVGSIAVQNPLLLRRALDEYGADKILLGADVRRGRLAINAWQTPTRIEIGEFLLDYKSAGGGQVFVTDIGRDGLLQGPSVQLYRDLLEAVPGLHLTASGGVSGMEDIYELERAGCAGVIVGKAIYEGKVSVEELAARGCRPVVED